MNAGHERVREDVRRGTPMRPGVLMISVTDPDVSLLQWQAAFEYTDSSWDDSRSFEREFQAVITCNAVIPALVTEANVYEVSTLISGLTNDMTTVFTPSTAVPPAVELVQINQDGSITPWSPT